jgi:hypothetical protein
MALAEVDRAGARIYRPGWKNQTRLILLFHLKYSILSIVCGHSEESAPRRTLNPRRCRLE